MHTFPLPSLLQRQSRPSQPAGPCTANEEGQVSPVPANSDLIWICRSGQWLPFEWEPLLANRHTRVFTQLTCKVRTYTLTGPLTLKKEHTTYLAGQFNYTLRTRQKEALWNSNIASPLHACKHLQNHPHYWFLALLHWSLLQANQWHTSSATTYVPTSEWALLGKDH